HALRQKLREYAASVQALVFARLPERAQNDLVLPMRRVGVPFHAAPGQKLVQFLRPRASHRRAEQINSQKRLQVFQLRNTAVGDLRAAQTQLHKTGERLDERKTTVVDFGRAEPELLEIGQFADPD